MLKAGQKELKSEVGIPVKKLAALFKDSEGSAEVVNLTYVTDDEPGITREKEGDGFVYVLKYREVKDKKVL